MKTTISRFLCVMAFLFTEFGLLNSQNTNDILQRYEQLRKELRAVEFDGKTDLKATFLSRLNQLKTDLDLTVSDINKAKSRFREVKQINNGMVNKNYLN